jgi:hypothetical protein
LIPGALDERRGGTMFRRIPPRTGAKPRIPR